MALLSLLDTAVECRRLGPDRIHARVQKFTLEAEHLDAVAERLNWMLPADRPPGAQVGRALPKE